MRIRPSRRSSAPSSAWSCSSMAAGSAGTWDLRNASAWNRAPMSRRSIVRRRIWQPSHRRSGRPDPATRTRPRLLWASGLLGGTPAHLDLPIPLARIVGGLRIRRGAVDDAAITEIEDRIVPRAADTLIFDGPFVQRPTRVAAYRTNRENLRAVAIEKDGRTADFHALRRVLWQ